MTKFPERIRPIGARAALASVLVWISAACSAPASEVNVADVPSVSASTTVPPTTSISKPKAATTTTTATTPTTTTTATATTTPLAAQARADALTLRRSDLGPGWVVQPPDDDDQGDADRADEPATEEFLRCANVPAELVVDPIASSESPTFTFEKGTAPSYAEVSSGAEVYADAGVVPGVLGVMQSDLGVACMDDMLGATVTEALERKGFIVASADLRRVDHPDLRRRGFLYDLVVKFERDGDRRAVELILMAVGDGDALLTLTLTVMGPADFAMVDELVQLAISKLEVA